MGKTSLRKRFLGEGFESNYLITIGADFSAKTIDSDQNQFSFQIWDLAGQPKYSTIRDIYYKGSLGALIVFDLTRPITLPVLEQWIEELYKYSFKAPIILLGNKSDLKEMLEESEETNDFINKIQAIYGLKIPAQLVLMGEKYDFDFGMDRLVTPREIKSFIERINEKYGIDVQYFETSALSGQNVDEAFLKLGEMIIEDRKGEM